MSTERQQIQNFGTSQQGSTNAGNWFANTSKPLPSANNFDSHQSFVTAQSAYDATKKRNGG